VIYLYRINNFLDLSFQLQSSELSVMFEPYIIYFMSFNELMHYLNIKR